MTALNPIPNADKRREYLRLEQERDEITNAKYAATQGVRQAKTAATELLWEEFRSKLNAFAAPFDAQIDAIEAEYTAKEDAINERLEELGDEIGCGDRRYNDGWEWTIECDLTGLPAFDDDVIIKDEDSGKVILHDALPWPKPEATP